VRVHQWLDTWLTTTIRVYGVDTPEKGWRGKCEYERELGKKATEFTKAFVNNGSFSITNISNDKFGGRLDADVIRDDGQSLAEALISNGFGYAYFGKAKTSWCKVK
jgi:endonuclease YncB( thermonuclease family)